MKFGFWQQQTAKIKIMVAFGLGVYLSLAAGAFDSSNSPAAAQAYRPEEVAQQVYQKLPELPSENQYLSQESGEIEPENSLISRLIRYHLYVKNRPFQYRLDWQLTIADYFGINEPIAPQQYPGNNTLETNPLEGDRAVITNLTLPQRRQLVDTILGIYNPNYDPSPQPVSLPQQNTDNSSPGYRPQKPQLPQPGDSELLLP